MNSSDNNEALSNQSVSEKHEPTTDHVDAERGQPGKPQTLMDHGCSSSILSFIATGLMPMMHRA